MLLPGNESKNSDAKSRDAAIASHDFAGSNEPIYTAGPNPSRFQTIWGGRVFMMIGFAVGVIGLARLSFHVTTQQAQELDPADHSGAGIIDRSELLHLWLPPDLSDLAKRQSQFPVVRTHEELQRFLELQDRKDLWFAMTTRGHQVNGKMIDITFIRWPYEDSRHFPELLDILATAAGNPRRDADADHSNASVHIIDQRLLKRDPREVVAELIGDPSPNVNPEDSH